MSNQDSGLRQNLEAMLARGQDSALLRFTLGNEYLKTGAYDNALEHLQRAVSLEPGYSAAWRQLGKAAQSGGHHARARQAWRDGIAAARAQGDVQAAKEMTVFLRRLDKHHPGPDDGGEER
ncbi:MAG: tetratricopeptide repeat protein [Gammaproteobacteria bacterium]